MKKDNNEEKFIAAIGRLHNDPQPVHIEISKVNLWEILCQLQLAFRHPLNTGLTRVNVEKIADQFAASLTTNEPDLRLLWHMSKSNTCQVSTRRRLKVCGLRRSWLCHVRRKRAVY